MKTRRGKKTFCLIFCSVFLGLFVGTVPSLSAAPSNESPVKSGFLYGFCIHLGQEENRAYTGPDTQTKLSRIGAASTRDDLSWDIRAAASLHDMPPSMTKIAYGLKNVDTRPLLILGDDRRFIPEGQPTTDASRKRFAAYATDAAKILKEKNPIFEIWNEWNRGTGNRQERPGSPASYVALVKDVYPAIKSVMPHGLVLGGAVGRKPGTTELDVDWTLKAVRLGLLNYVDGLSVHVYDRCMKPAQGTGVEVLEHVKALHDAVMKVSPGKDVPFYITELGWPGERGVCGGQGEALAADGIAQTLLAAPTLPWLKGVWFYDLIDDGDAPENREHHWGQYRFDGNQKPSGCAARAVWSFIAETGSPHRTKPAPNVTMVTYKTKEGPLRVALWQTDVPVWKKDPPSAPRRVRLPSTARLLPFCGKEPIKEKGSVLLGRTPLLMEIPADALSAVKVE
ncbi:MAG: hypothetical protein PHS57_09105 [Alphaproteobacteria bacterium]|nr:hypothetical protein [Alphaproteobacteria bacterium]